MTKRATPNTPERLATFVTHRLRRAAVSADAPIMQAYMKTEMPYFGVKKPGLVPIFREMKRRFAPQSRREYEAGIRALWQLDHREQKYAALEYASQHPAWITPKSLPLYERLVREGAWWDLVDNLVSGVISPLYLDQRKTLRPTINRWIDDEHLWVRRAALLAHLKHKEQTDQRQLFRHCLRRADEREFFIRKAIGWALRQYSYVEPQAVRTFLLEHQDRLSGLSYREGAKVLVRRGQM